MDFGAILDKWEKQSSGNAVYNKDRDDLPDYTAYNYRRKYERRSRLLRKSPDASIDLHGLTRDEAWSRLEAFFEDSRKKGYEKIQIIHGKGSHGNTPPNEIDRFNEGALRELSRRFIENCSYAGESGPCPAKEGGTGATWVIIRRKKLTFAVNNTAPGEIIGG